jgi:hypothetical protein
LFEEKPMENQIRWMQDAGPGDLPVLGEELALLCGLRREEFPVLPGFVVLPSAYEQFLEDHDIARKARAALSRPATLSPEEREASLKEIRAVFQEAGISPSLVAGIREAYRRLTEEEAVASLPVSVRPFLLPEIVGLPIYSRAWDGMNHVQGPERLIQTVRTGWMWAWTGEAFGQVVDSGVDPFSVRVVLLVQRFVVPRVGGLFLPGVGTDPGKQERVIEACWGMGEALVTGGWESDRFVLKEAPVVLLEQSVGSKEKKWVPPAGGDPGIEEVGVPEDLAEMPCLGWEQIQEIAETGRAVEQVSGERRRMQWAYSNGSFFLLRAPAMPGNGGEKRSTVEAGEPEGSGPPEAAAEEDTGSGSASPVGEEVVRAAGSDRGEWPEPDRVDRREAPLGEPETPPHVHPRTDRTAETPSQGPGSGDERKPGFPDEASSGETAPRFPADRNFGGKLSWKDRVRADLLASLFRSAKKRRGVGGPVQERDEFSHRHTGSRYWNESYYFNFSDPKHNLGGFSRIGMVPNQDMAVGILYLFLPEGGILMLTQTEPCRASRDRVSAGGLSYERVQPLWNWRIRFQGNMLYLHDPAELPSLLTASTDERDGMNLSFREASVDMAFRGWSPCHNFKDVDPGFVAERFVSAGSRLRDLTAVSKVASEHYEQVGSWEGEVVVDGRRMDVRGTGHRDHSWGDRDWKAPRKWTWLTAQFGDGIGFNLSRVVIRSLDLFNGYVCRSGRNYPLRRAWLDTEFDADGLTQKRILLRLEDTSGWAGEIEGKPQCVVPLILQEDLHRTQVNEAFTAYRWNGRTGYGISEYLHQLGDRP